MKLIRNEKHVKTYPKKFNPIIGVFNPTCAGKRLSDMERNTLGCLLARHKLHNEFLHRTDNQSKYAFRAINSGDIVSITQVSNRAGIVGYDVKFDGFTPIRVGYNLICDYPSGLIGEKKVF